MKFEKLAQWLGFSTLLLIVSLISAIAAIKITKTQEQNAAATQQVIQFNIEQTQTTQALEKELTEFNKNITLSAHLEDCTKNDTCDSWANKVLVIYVVNKNSKNIQIEWDLTTLSCKKYSSDKIDPYGGTAMFRCSAFERPFIDSIDYVREACMTFTASIVSTDDAQTEICSDVSNLPVLQD